MKKTTLIILIIAIIAGGGIYWKIQEKENPEGKGVVVQIETQEGQKATKVEITEVETKTNKKNETISHHRMSSSMIAFTIPTELTVQQMDGGGISVINFMEDDNILGSILVELAITDWSSDGRALTYEEWLEQTGRTQAAAATQIIDEILFERKEIDKNIYLTGTINKEEGKYIAIVFDKENEQQMQEIIKSLVFYPNEEEAENYNIIP